MDFYSALQYVAFIAVLTVCVKPLGRYLERVFSGQKTALDRLCSPIEWLIYRVTAVNSAAEMGAREYATCFVLFSLAGTLLLYLILRLQNLLPWFYPQYQTTPLTPDLAMNSAISFSTTTTWQAYGAENTMSYFSQMAGLCAQNFLAAAAGLAVGMAFIRGFARQRSGTLGNFWVDLTRSLLWVLLPGALLGAVLLLWQGVPMNFHPYAVATSLEGVKHVIPQGPVAAWEIIKNLGTNGGGFFNANGAHPYENPTPLANFLAMLAIALLPAALTNTFGRMTRQPRQGWTLYCVMLALFVAGLTVTHWAEHRNNRSIAGVDQSAGNMEGKEVRFGVGGSVLTATVTSNTATGSYNAMHDSFSPLGGMALLVNMLLGEVAFGGLGTGMYGMLMIAVTAVFLTGLMVGRTPEYLGKKIGPEETKMVLLYALAAPLTILPLTALAVLTKPGLAGLTTNQGVHGFTEIVFAYTSCFANNGQTFAGLSANTVFFNVTTCVAMILGRFALAVPALALAGLLARQQSTPLSAGTLRTDSALFALALTVTILIVAGLCYFPSLTLGTILEHLNTMTHDTILYISH